MTTINEEAMTQRCIDSINRNSHLRNALKSGTEDQQRTILTAWYLGDSSRAESGSTSGGQTVNLETFVRNVLPEVRKQAA